MAHLALAETARRISAISRRPPASDRAPLSVDSLLALVDRHAPGLRGHMDRTGALSRSLAERLGLSDRVAGVVERAGQLHDVGKLVLPRELLLNPRPLGRWELALVRQHTLVGQRLLECTQEARGMGELVRASHERYDGTGYPDRLRGSAIPLAARIVAVCDAFDAMTESRTYRAPLTPRAAAEELWRGSGTQFDPKITTAFCDVVRALV